MGYKCLLSILVETLRSKFSQPRSIVCALLCVSLMSWSRFESNASAARAKQQLDGADIYAGCCTLKIEYAKVCYN